ncbi:hypothetical protein FSP39_000753 [Pinctada imbricata]|uniref:G-protein coupled receptors family 1 profile domain-containing protein n=1 Tax=Pinctada imbricata TaxID=66713 RepID=A0AA88XY86_PINIB|nr:hypothetical protein FSP39_000753 [Pinctada imbricata]
MDNNTDMHDVEYGIFLEYRLSAVVILSIISILGTVGNIHVLAVYRRIRRSKLRQFILVLACNDLIGSCVATPLNIFDLRYVMTMKWDVYCKFTRLITYHTTMASGLLLAVVAYERYRRVCDPFGAQMTFRQMKIGCISTILTAFVLALPTVYFYGSVPTDIKERPDLNNVYHGKMCGPHETHQTVPYFSCLLFIGTVVLIAEVFFYTSIIISIIRWKRYKKYLLSRNDENKCPDERSALLDMENSRKYLRYQNPKLTGTAGDGEAERKKEMDKMDTAARLSLMFMLNVIFSYVGYIPIIVFSIIQAADPHAFLSVLSVVESSIAMLNRLYFLNNIVNPTMYGLMDKQFRSTCKIMYIDCLAWI